MLLQEALLGNRKDVSRTILKLKVKLPKGNVDEEDDEQKKTKKQKSSKGSKKIPSMFGDVIATLKTHRDRKLDKELRDIDARKKSREVEYFLSQRQFFMTKVFTNNHELRFARHRPKHSVQTRSTCKSPFVTKQVQCGSDPVEPEIPPTCSPVKIGATLPVTPDNTLLTSPCGCDTSTPSPTSPCPSVRSRPNTMTSQGRPPTRNKKHAIQLRELLFLEESQEPPTANRRRILQAKAQMFRSSHAPRKRHSLNDLYQAGSSREEGGQLPQILTVDCSGKQQVKRTLSDGGLKQRLACLQKYTMTCSEASPNAPSASPGVSLCLEGGTLKSNSLRNEPEGSADEAHREKGREEGREEAGRPLREKSSQRAARVTWSRTLVHEEEVSTRCQSEEQDKEGDNHRNNSRPKQHAVRDDPIDGDQQEKLLQKIMLTIPPGIIAKATAHATNLSDLLGYTEHREALLMRERRHCEQLGKADNRFKNLIHALKD